MFCAPLADQTRGIGNATLFATMKPGSVLVNVGRGPLLDAVTLLSALDRRVPEHAFLDVFNTEPLPDNSRFWTHARVVLTAHTSGSTKGQDRRNDQLFLDNLQCFLDGEPLRNEVNIAEMFPAG